MHFLYRHLPEYFSLYERRIIKASTKKSAIKPNTLKITRSLGDLLNRPDYDSDWTANGSD